LVAISDKPSKGRIAKRPRSQKGRDIQPERGWSWGQECDAWKYAGEETKMAVWHLTLESKGRQHLFPAEESLRAAVRALAAAAGGETLLFCVVDDHVHVVVCCDRARAGRLAQAVSTTLRPLATVPTKRLADIAPVEDRRHMERLVGYLVKQPPHHNLPVHPALWTGSCFPDLIGARAIRALGQPLLKFLPRFRLTEVMEYVGLEPRLPEPASDAAIRAAGATRLVSAVNAALALPDGGAGNRWEVVLARVVTSALASTAGIATGETAAALGKTMRCVQRRALDTRIDDTVLKAVRTRLTLEDAVARALGARVP